MRVHRFVRSAPAAAMHRGDLVAIGQAGAYGASFTSRYNGRPSPGEVLLWPDGSLQPCERPAIRGASWPDPARAPHSAARHLPQEPAAPWGLPRQQRSPCHEQAKFPWSRVPIGRRRPRSRRTVTALTAAALGLTLAAAGAATGTPASAATAAGSATHSSATVLRVEADTSFSTFNPFLAYFNADLYVIGSIYPTLTMINEKGSPSPTWRPHGRFRRTSSPGPSRSARA